MFKQMILAAAVVGLVLALAPAAQAATIGLNDPLVPTGLGLNDTFHLVFVTSTTTSVQAIGTPISWYNTFVNSVANSGDSDVARLGLTWYVVGSTANVNARDNAAVVSTAVYRVDGARIVTGTAPFYGGHENPINVTEKSDVFDKRVWTGSTPSGTPRENGYDKSDNYCITGGSWMATSPHWIEGPGENWFDYIRPKTELNALYALSEKITIVPEPATLALLGLGGLGMLLSRKRK